jgi:hypothetical protein
MAQSVQWLRYRLDRRIGVRFPTEADIFSSPEHRNRFWLTRHPIQYVQKGCDSPNILSNMYQQVVTRQASYRMCTKGLWLTKHPIQCVPKGCGKPSILSIVYQPVVTHQAAYPMCTKGLWLTKHPIQWVPKGCNSPSNLCNRYQPAVAQQASYPKVTNSFLSECKAAEAWNCTLSSNYCRG